MGQDPNKIQEAETPSESPPWMAEPSFTVFPGTLAERSIRNRAAGTPTDILIWDAVLSDDLSRHNAAPVALSNKWSD